MISWIQNTFQHHFKTVFAVLLAVIVVSFVFTIGASPGIGNAGHKVHKREFFGRDLSREGTSQQISRDAELSLMMALGFNPYDGMGFERYALSRLASLALADQYRIGKPGKDELAKFVTTLGAFQNEQGQFDPIRYNAFADNLRKSQQIPIGEVTRVMEEDYRIQKVQEVLAGPGYVLPVEIANVVSMSTTSWTIRVAALDFEQFQPAINPTEAELNEFFEQNPARYEVPPRVSVDYVTFPSAPHLASVAPTENDITRFFEANRQRFPKPSADPSKPSTEPAELVDVRPQVEAALRTEMAASLAAKAASDFAYALFDQKVPQNSPVIDELAQKFGGRRATAPLFTEENGPQGLGWSPEVVATAFRLASDRYFSDALAVGSDQVVLLWRETLPVYKPTLAEVRPAVVADFKADRRSRRFVESGQAWKAALEAKLAAGVAFDSAAADLPGAGKVEVKAFGPFTLRDRAEGLDPAVLASLERLQSGSVSDLIRNGPKGYLVHVVARSTPPLDPQSPEYSSARTQIAASAARTTQGLVIAELVENERRRTAPPSN